MSAVGRITESQNELTTSIDVAGARSIVRLLRGSDAQLFAGYGALDSIYDAPTTEAAEKIAELVSAGLARSLVGSDGGGALHVVLSGSGTSGRFAFTTARAMNRTFGACLKAAAHGVVRAHFHYCNSGGDRGLLRESEGAEDSPSLALADLQAVEARTGSSDRLLLVGISCGFSAGYVGAQLAHAMDNPARYAGVVALGFNPRERVQRVQLPGWGATFRDVLDRLAEGDVHAEQLRLVWSPVVGPEPISGSTRMKGGSATKVLLDTSLNLAIVSAVQRMVEGSDSAAKPSVASLLAEFETASRCAYAPAAVAQLAQLAKLAADALRQRGRLVYLGEGPAGLLGIVDASECPPTYGASLTDVSGFVHGGWSTMENVEGDVSLLPREAGEAHTLQLSINWFVREVVPQLGAADVVAVLQIGAASDVAVQAAAAAAAERGARVATIRVEQAPVLADCAANDVQIWLPCLRQRSLEAWLRRLSAQGAAGPVAAAALCELPPSAAELALKVAVNAVSTCAHVLNGTVFSNCMINLTISNIKLFHRAAALVSRLGGVELEHAQRFLLRAIYGDDEGQTVSVDAVAQHVTRASTVEQVLPVSLLLAIRSRSSGASGASNISVAEARALVSEQPVLRTILQNS